MSVVTVLPPIFKHGEKIREVIDDESYRADSLSDSPDKQVAVERPEITVVKTHWAPYRNEGSHLFNKTRRDK